MGKAVWITTGVVAGAIGLMAIVAHAERGDDERRGFRGHHGAKEQGDYGRRRGWRRRDITKEDFDARTRSRFAEWDANSDGVVDANEAEARFARRIERRFRRRGNRHMGRMLRRLDADGDGKVTRQELEARVSERFKRLDLTSDGRITDEDLPPILRDRDFLSRDVGARRGRWRAWRRGGHRRRGGGRRMFRQLAGADTNNDGAVTQQELLDKATKRFNRFDRNKDGLIDQADREKLVKDTISYRVLRFMHRFGAGKEGRLTLDQFVKHRNERFAKRDIDGDGVLQRSERRRGRRWQRGRDGERRHRRRDRDARGSDDGYYDR